MQGPIDNASGELDRKMKSDGHPRPKHWTIDRRPLGLDNPQHKIVANPHHLIPGNESLKKATTLLPWIFGDKGKIENDIGYNVNNASNGVWLPSNNSMRGHSYWKSVPGEKEKGKAPAIRLRRASTHPGWCFSTGRRRG